MLDRLCDAVYDRLKNGMFGKIFTSYPDVDRGFCARAADSAFRSNVLSPARRKLASKIENSLFLELYTKIVRYLLSVRMRVYGVGILSFLLYTAVVSGIGYLRSRDSGSADILSVAIPALLCLATLPLLFSEISLSEALSGSLVGRLVLSLTGRGPEKLDMSRRLGRSNIAFIIGLLFGLLTYFVSPIYIVGAAAALVIAAIVMNSPAFGAIMLFFFMPLLPTLLLVGIVMLSAFSLILKVIRGKRFFRFEALDIAVFMFLLMTGIGGLFGASPVSLKSGAVAVMFIVAYYVVVVSLDTREWLGKAVGAFVLSATMISFYGMIQYMTHKVAGANGWVDQKMFSYIEGRAVATLENPNMLAVYLILAFPVAFTFMLTFVRGLRGRAVSLISVAAIGVCLIFTWSRGSWLGLIAAAFLFIMIWGRRSIYVFICGILSIPFLPYIIPQSIWLRFTSIGNTADSSTAFRVNILKSIAGMLPDRILCGLGIGEESWYVIYPKIALSGVQWAPHSHNLYLQIWIQTGFLSLIIFLAFVVLLFTSNFNFYRMLSDAESSVMSHISAAPLKESCLRCEPRQMPSDRTDDEKEIRRTKTAMRLQAASPLCGVLAVLVMGFTDYVWYNYRVFLMFWLTCALSSAYVRCGRRELEFHTPKNEASCETGFDVDIPIESKVKGKGRS